jgi:hypothetical protein
MDGHISKHLKSLLKELKMLQQSIRWKNDHLVLEAVKFSSFLLEHSIFNTLERTIKDRFWGSCADNDSTDSEYLIYKTEDK